jgi:hypothetical protein
MSKKQTGTFTLLHPIAAGIDVGASCHYVCAGSPGNATVKRFGTFTEDLYALAGWLCELGVTTAALESTGVYWVNLYDVLESKGIKVCLANARYVKNVPGRKSDVSDCQWIWQLHSFGLLSGSFIADDSIRELRTYVRQRESLEQQKVTQINMMNKALQLLNIKLRQVMSKTDTVAGMNIIRAIVAGERDGAMLSETFHHRQMKASKEELAKALQGNWKREHLFCLKQAMACYDFACEQMLVCEAEIERVLDQMGGGEGDESRKKSGKIRQNDYSFKAKDYLGSITGTDFTSASAVTFGGVPAASFTVTSATSISAVLATGNSGDVAVTTPSGSGSAPGFSYVYTLPATNFRISATGETCKTSNNGLVTITAAKALNYTATITGSSATSSYTFTNALEIKDLSAGTYSVCITVEGRSDYKQCYDVVITEPKDLSTYVAVNEREKLITLDLAGGTMYKVELNGIIHTTSKDQMTLPITEGDNTLRITTDNLCQGVVEKHIRISEGIQPFPNPFDRIVSLDLGEGRAQLAEVEVRDFLGKLVYAKRLSSTIGIPQLDLGDLIPGVYTLRLMLDQRETYYKIVKR